MKGFPSAGAFGKLGEKPIVCQVIFLTTVAILIWAEDLAWRCVEKIDENLRRR